MRDAKNSIMYMVDHNWTSTRLADRCIRVMIQALPTNLNTVWMAVGMEARTGYGRALDPGDSVDFALDTIAKLDFSFVNAADHLCLIYEVE